jgi:hypothetical protein
MHPEARKGAARMLRALGIERNWQGRVLDVGGADWNGSLRHLLPDARWTAVDIEDGPGVDLVRDARIWVPEQGEYDLFMCTEVLEHVEHWRSILRCLRAVGTGVVTCASKRRPPHGARGGALPEPGEWYGNISEEEFVEAATASELWPGGAVSVEYRYPPGDLYAALASGE